LNARFRKSALLALAVVTSALLSAGSAGAQTFGPPWCGTPEPDATAESIVSTGPSSFPHIPYYAIGCTLDGIEARSLGRRMVVRHGFGVSAQGRPLHLATINALDTRAQRTAYRNWIRIRRIALTNPARAQRLLRGMRGRVKVPLYVQSGIHGNESEGVDSSLQIIDRLATTPYGTDAEVDAILKNAIVIFNVVHNPDGRVLNRRTNGNGFDLNRDFLTQSQSETKASVRVMQRWLPPDVLDLHGYVTPTLIEATTKPHNPSIEYDLWLKWNQARIDANEAAMNANGYAVTRPINDWCPEGDLPPTPGGPCEDGVTRPGPATAEGWDDWGPFYTPMYAQHIALNGSTVEMCNQTDTRCLVSPTSTAPRGRIGARTVQYIVTWSTLLYDVAHRVALTRDQLQIYKRGVNDAPRPACCPPPFDVANNWMTDYPKAFLIPVGANQRSNAEANRLVRWLLDNGIRVWETTRRYTYEGRRYRNGSYVVWMTQAHRGLAGTALGLGSDISTQINQLYAPPAAWSHGYLWGADVETIPDGAAFRPPTRRVRRPHAIPGGLDAGPADRYALKLDSATAVRVLNQLLGGGTQAQLALASFASATGEALPAGTAVFSADAATAARLDQLGDVNGVRFRRISAGSLPALEPIDRVPRIAVLTAAVNQDVWSLRNLGFVADPVATEATSPLNTPAAADPLLAYDLIFNTAAWPAGTTAQARLTAFFARGGGYIGAGANGAAFLTSASQVLGLTAETRGGAGRSGIVRWLNTGGGNSPIVGVYPQRDFAIMDPPTWFTSTGSLAVDGRFPTSDMLASGFWLTSDTQSASAPGSPVIAHGTNATGTSRVTVFAMNPLYRADPEREWPAVSSAAYWSDQ
jgi:hypothetical protein